MDKFTQLLHQVAKFAWPAALLVILFIYREPIQELVTTRSVKLGTGGVEFGAPAQAAQAQATQASASLYPPQASSINRSEPFPAEYKSLAILVEQVVENSVPGVMAQYGFDREKALKYIATTYMGATYLERASRHIFGSQVDALEMVNASNGSVKLSALQEIYMKASSQSPAVYQNIAFEQWLVFLTRQQLVDVSGERVTSTPGGIAVLAYMKMQGYLNFRPPN